MKPQDVKIGIAIRVDGFNTKRYVASLPDKNNKCKLAWDSGLNEVPDIKYSCDDFNPVDQEQDILVANELQAVINKAKMSFEEAFEALAILKNSNSLSAFEDEGLVSLKEMQDVISQNGWRTSSLWC